MKLKVLIPVFVAGAVVLGGCSNTKKEESKDNNSNKDTTQTTQNVDSKSEAKKEDKKAENKVYGLNEEWVVDGQWKVKVTGVTVTTQRNQFSDTNPAEVVVVNYTYENLGYTDDIQDLFLTPKTVIDGAKKVVSTYPVNLPKTPKATPVGAVCEAQEAFGLTVASDKIQINFEKFGSNDKVKHKATFEVPVTK